MSLPEVREIMIDAPLVVTPDEQLSKVLGKIKEQGAYVVPVVNADNKLVGVLTYKDLLERRVSLKSTVERVMSPPYSVSEDTTLERVVAKFVELRVRAIPVVDSSMRLVGMVRREDVIAYFRDNGMIPNVRVRQVMSQPAIVIDANEAIARAKWLMIRNGISRLPVLDGGKLCGIVTMRDIVEKFFYASLPRRQRRKGEVAGTEIDILAAPVRAIATTPVITAYEYESLTDVVNRLLTRRISGLPVLAGDAVVGVLSTYDILKMLLVTKEALPVTAKIPEDLEDYQKAMIERIISNYLAKLNRMTHVIDLKINIKKYAEAPEAADKRHKYSAHIVLQDNNTTYTANEVDWDPVNAVRYAFEVLLRRVERSIKKTRDVQRRAKARERPSEGFEG